MDGHSGSFGSESFIKRLVGLLCTDSAMLKMISLYEGATVSQNFTDDEKKALYVLADFAAKHCGGGEDIMGAILYTGAFHWLPGDHGKNEDGTYSVVHKLENSSVVELAKKIEAHKVDVEFPPNATKQYTKIVGLSPNHQVYRIKWSEEDGEWVGTCDKFPGLSWLDDTPRQAFDGIVKLVKDVEDDIRNSGE
jgi:hypothetical protein